MGYVTPTSGGGNLLSLPSINLGSLIRGSRAPATSSATPSATIPGAPYYATGSDTVFGGVATAATTSAPAGAQLIGFETTLPADGSIAYMFRWLLAWTVVLLVLWLINKTSLGHVALYYLLALSLVFLVVTQYKWFAQALAPLTGTLVVPTAQSATPNPIPPAVGGVISG